MISVVLPVFLVDSVEVLKLPGLKKGTISVALQVGMLMLLGLVKVISIGLKIFLVDCRWCNPLNQIRQ